MQECNFSPEVIAPWQIRHNNSVELSLKLDNSLLEISGKPNDALEQNFLVVTLSPTGNSTWEQPFRRVIERKIENIGNGLYTRTLDLDQPGYEAYSFAGEYRLFGKDVPIVVRCPGDEELSAFPNPFCHGMLFPERGNYTVYFKFSGLSGGEFSRIATRVISISKLYPLLCKQG